MTPKEKARELVDKFLPHTLVLNKDTGWLEGKDDAKQYALITVKEILNNDNNFFSTYIQNDYWLQVKQEIEKL